MPTARSGFGVAVVNGKIYAIGGGSVVNEMYDPKTDTWTTKAPMPTARSGFGIAVVQNKIYVMGGDDSGLNKVYDPATNTWTTKASLPTPRGGIYANVVDGKIYVVGGAFSGANADVAIFYDVNEVYDPATDTWTIKAPIPTPVTGYASAVVDNKIYVIGGSTVNWNEVNLTQIYDPATGTWSNGTPIPTIVAGAGAGATKGVSAPKRIYVIGGVHYYSPILYETVNFTQVYDPETDDWSMGATMSKSRTGFGVAVVDDVLYAIGGNGVIGSGSLIYGISGPPYGTNEQYTPFGYELVLPAVSVFSPENKTYTSVNVSLTFTVNRPVVWTGFSLDGQDNVTITGNTTLYGLSSGLHNVTVYAKDAFENTGTSETIIFSIAEKPEPEPFPTTLVVASAVSVAIVGTGILIYFRKRHH